MIPIQGKWSTEKINKWYEEQPWLVGCNYYPSTAINQIEMWQASTWDPKTIDKELSRAADIGMNTLRVFLHDLVWKDYKEGLYSRMNEFLSICKNMKYDHGLFSLTIAMLKRQNWEINHCLLKDIIILDG